jgi:protein-S-isoprenylcysteine O-methyltransferase Ste14
VAVLLPWSLTRWHAGAAPAGATPIRALGWVVAAIGVVTLCDAFSRFAWIGRGTPAPILPTETLIVSGLHRYVRNPMYLSVLTIILGQAIGLWRFDLLVYMALMAVAFHIFVLLVEEPMLERQFGQDYARYRVHVRRWRPRWRPWEP